MPRWLAGLGIVGLVVVPACTTIVVPPRAPVEPRPVFLLDHGRHSTLVLPRPEGRTVRYSYGDWRYYVLGDTGVFQASRAVFWPSAAGFGRRELSAPPTLGAVRQAVLVPIEHAYELHVEARDVERLRRELEALFRANLDTRLYNPGNDLEFVRHPRRYWFAHNSNHVVAGWLRELGCEVRGPAILASWRVETETGRRRARPRRYDPGRPCPARAPASRPRRPAATDGSSGP